jgi:hypothetical protein
MDLGVFSLTHMNYILDSNLNATHLAEFSFKTTTSISEIGTEFRNRHINEILVNDHNGTFLLKRIF